MQKHFFLIVAFLLVAQTGQAQNGINKKEMVGFGCYITGESTKPVYKMYELIADTAYDKIIRLLDSKNNAERFLAVVVLEKLDRLNRLELKAEQAAKIEAFYKSKEKFSVCNGCTYWDTLRLKEGLKKDSDIRKLAEYWLGERLK